MSSSNTTLATDGATPTELTETFGVLLIGFIFTVTLYGLTFFQTYIYYTRFPHDARKTKYTVGLLWAVDTAITTLISHTIYHYLITDFLLPFSQLITTRTFLAEEALSVFLALVVQCYYAFRIYRVSGRRVVISAAIVLLGLAAFAFDIGSVAKMTNQSMFHQVVSQSVKLTKGICWGLSIGADLLITASKLWYLRPGVKPGMARPDGWYEKAVVYGVNRGTSFTIFQIISLITLVTMPNQQIWILFHWFGGKVYVNSTLSMLNFRNSIRGRGLPEEASQNQQVRYGNDDTNGSFSTGSGVSGGALDTTNSVHFNNFNPDTKTTEAMNLELDLVPVEGEVASDDIESGDQIEVTSRTSATEGSSKPRDFAKS
ncbi:hypothetical protein C2E23DRAFT_473697 [Lenzites betulinus]|nr:hypothetical protein C2E23DRAFT_473697 [Lenzites betulinus]